MGFPLFVLAVNVQNSCLQCAGGPEGRLTSIATEMSAPCSAERRPAPPSALRRGDPTRLLCVRVLDSTGWNLVWLLRDLSGWATFALNHEDLRHTLRENNCRTHLSSPKPEHTTHGSRRHDAGRTAGRGDAGQNKVPTFRSLWKPTAPLAIQRTVNECSERLFASTNKGNPL